MNINKIIDIIHTLKEEGMGVGAVSGPTNSLAGEKIAGTERRVIVPQYLRIGKKIFS